MARRYSLLAMASVLVAALAFPSAAPAQETETDELPPYAAAELEAARAAGYDPVAEAQRIPDPPNGISQAQRVEAVPYSERDRGEVDFGDFYTGLARHGTWVETPEYGYVFIPHRQAQVANWRPYTYGRWIWTEYGWTWVSEEPFGWATYHYGRWTFLPSFGWAWVPGYVWGPAWVAWRFGDTAIGWAPLYPGYVTWTASYPYYASHWVFIGHTHFYGHPVHRHHYHWRDVDHYYRHTHWAHHWHEGPSRGRGYVYAGPPRSYVERTSRRTVRVTELRRADRPSVPQFSGAEPPRQVSVYRPQRRGEVTRLAPQDARVRIPENQKAPRVGSGLVAPGAVRTGPLENGRSDAVRSPAVGERSRVQLPDPKAQRFEDGNRGRVQLPDPKTQRLDEGNRGRVTTPRAEPSPGERSRGGPGPLEPADIPRSPAPRAAEPVDRPKAPSPVSSQPRPKVEAERRSEPARIRTPTANPPAAPKVEPRAAPQGRAVPKISVPERSTPSKNERSNLAPRLAAPSGGSSAPRISAPRSAPRISAPSAPRSTAPRIAAPGASGGSRGSVRRER